MLESILEKLKSNISIDDIKSVMNTSRGPALRSTYLVNVFAPLQFLSEGFGSGAALSFLAYKQLSYLAQSASLPGKQFATTSHRIYGTIREMPYGVLYEPMDITFMCTNIMVERAFFDVWQSYIMSPKSCYMNYYNNYTGRVIIQKIDNAGIEYGSIAGEIISTYVLEEAYPKIVQSQELSYASKNDPLTLTVSFSYARWRSSVNIIAEQFFDIGVNSGVDNSIIPPSIIMV
jgi:hypothetical protein